MAARHQGTLNRPNPLPREVARGIFWLGECLEQRQQGKIYHGCNASFLIVGETASMLVETGHPKDFPITEAQLNTLLPGRAAAEISVCYAPGDPALRRARPRADALPGSAPGR